MVRSNADLARELIKIADVVRLAYDHHRHENLANAALHMSAVRYSPLTVALEGAFNDLERLAGE